MPLIQMIVVIAVFGLIMWLINTYIPMAAPFKQIINVLVVVVLIVWLLSAVGLLGGLYAPMRLR